MNKDELVFRVALAMAEANQPGVMYVKGDTPTDHMLQEAYKIVSLVEKVTVDNRRERVIEFLEEGKRQAETLFEDTNHPMWLGKIIAYVDVMEAVRYGAFGGVEE